MLEGLTGDGGDDKQFSSAISASIPVDIEALPDPLNLSMSTGLASKTAALVDCGYELTLAKEESFNKWGDRSEEYPLDALAFW
jgi:hypothetical protein